MPTPNLIQPQSKHGDNIFSARSCKIFIIPCASFVYVWVHFIVISKRLYLIRSLCNFQKGSWSRVSQVRFTKEKAKRKDIWWEEGWGETRSMRRSCEEGTLMARHSGGHCLQVSSQEPSTSSKHRTYACHICRICSLSNFQHNPLATTNLMYDVKDDPIIQGSSQEPLTSSRPLTFTSSAKICTILIKHPG